MSPDRADELSYGDERPAPLWPRGWLVVTAVIATAALAAGLQLGRRGAQRDTAAEAALPLATTTVTATATATVTAPGTASASPTPAPAPTALTGPLLDRDIDGEVIIGGGQAALLDLGSRRSRPITGLRTGERLETALQTAAGTVLLTYTASSVDARPASLYLLPPRSTAATRLSAGAAYIMAGSTPRTFWTWRESGPAGGDDGALTRTGEERRADGSVIRRVTLPRGAHIVQVAGDHLLLHAADDSATGPWRVTLWDPATRKAVLQLPPGVQPAASSPTAVAWVGPSCSTAPSCTLHVTSLPDGADSVLELALPDGAEFHGTFNARSDAIAGVVAEGGNDGTPPRQHAYVVSASSGATMRITAGELPESGWVVGWTPDDAAVVFSSGEGLHQLAVWRRSGGALEVVTELKFGARALAVRPG